MLINESKRDHIVRDIRVIGYHLILKWGVASALLTANHDGELCDRLTGRAVKFVTGERHYDSDGGGSPLPRSRRRGPPSNHIEI